MRCARYVSQLAAVALAIGLLSGCGTDSAPTAAMDESPLAPAAKKAKKAGETKKAGKRGKAAKTRAHSESVTADFTGEQGGTLRARLKARGEKGSVWVEKATFEVAPGAMGAERAEITMSVTSGDSFDDVAVQFSPPGTSFEPAAILTLELRGEKKKKDKDLTEAEARLAADHITADGTVTDVVLTTERRGAYKIIVTIEVPGFSLYGLRD